MIQPLPPGRSTVLSLDDPKLPLQFYPRRSWDSRDSTRYNVSRRYVPQSMFGSTDDPLYRSRRPSSSSRQVEEYVHSRRHRSPSPHRGTRHHRRDSSPPPRRRPSPPSRHPGKSISGVSWPSDLFRWVSSLQSRHVEHRRRSSDDRCHSPSERRRRRGSREPGYYTVSRDGSRRSSVETMPRSSPDSRGLGSG